MPHFWLVIVLLVGAAVAAASLFRPFVGILAFLAIHFIQPGELIPALAPLRIEMVYGVLLFGVLLLRHIRRPKVPTEKDRIVMGALALLGVAALSIPLAVWPGGAFTSTTELAKLIAVLFLMRTLIDSKKHMRATLWLMMVLLGWYSVSSLLAYRSGDFYNLRYGNGMDVERAQGLNSIVGGPNELAGLILALLPFLVALIRTSRQRLARVLLLALAGCSIAALVLTGSRTALLSLPILGAYYILRSRHKVVSLVIGIVLACVIWSSMPATYQQRYLTVESYAAGGQLDDSNQFRLEIWSAGWKMFLHNPFVGVGAGQFPNAFGEQAHHWMNPHNLFLQVGCELGILGLIAFAYFAAQIRKAIGVPLRLVRKPAFRFHYEVALACNVMFIGVLVLSITGHTMYRPFWYLLGGLAAANLKLVRETQRKDAKPAEQDKDSEPVLCPESVPV
jgi:putative inorganic carbon (hco3(-)) transporter